MLTDLSIDHLHQIYLYGTLLRQCLHHLLDPLRQHHHLLVILHLLHLLGTQERVIFLEELMIKAC